MGISMGTLMGRLAEVPKGAREADVSKKTPQVLHSPT